MLGKPKKVLKIIVQINLNNTFVLQLASEKLMNDTN